MARERTQRKRPGGPAGAIKRRNCYFCKEHVAEIDYKNVNQLRRYISEKGKIRSRRITGQAAISEAPTTMAPTAWSLLAAAATPE